MSERRWLVGADVDGQVKLYFQERGYPPIPVNGDTDFVWRQYCEKSTDINGEVGSYMRVAFFKTEGPRSWE